MNLQKFLLLAAAAVLTAAFGQHYFRNNTKKEKQVLVFKALATAMPVMLAFLYALTAQEVHRTLSLMILAGAFLCMTADVLLELYFLSGVVSFGLGHVCFIAAYMHLTQFRGYTVLIFLLFFLLMLLLHGKFLPQPGWQMILMLGYAALLSAMSAMAVTAAVQLGSPAGYLTAAGGICFYISDNILGFRLLHETKSRVLSGVLLTLYYSAVYLIAAAMYFL